MLNDADTIRAVCFKNKSESNIYMLAYTHANIYAAYLLTYTYIHIYIHTNIHVHTYNTYTHIVHTCVNTF